MIVALPSEVWHLVCEHLEEQRDFGALFNASLVSKTLAGAALKSLYRIHSHSPVISEGNEIEMPRAGGLSYVLQVKAISKWALQWRSIILSSLGQTRYPYCQYIKSLDLRNLSQLFENGIFRDKVQNSFFTNEIAALITSSKSSHAKKFGKQSTGRHTLKFNADLSREVIGESITKYVYEEAQRHDSVAALEEISGEIPQVFLGSWCGRLARLKALTLWDGNSLSRDVAQQIRGNCPDFQSLSLLFHLGDDADSSLAEFFDNLRPNSLKYFEMIGSNNIHETTFSALSKHSKSLTELKLSSLKSDAILCLALLKDCQNLTTLAIQDREGVKTESDFEPDAFLDIISWLRGCRNLKNLTIDRIVFGASLVIAVLLDDSIKLQKLEMLQFLSPELFSALSHHESLEELKLRGDAPTLRGDVSDLVNNICSLPRLRILDLLGVSDNFHDSEVRSICEHLHELRELSTGGDNITNSVLPHLLNLPHLNSLQFNAITPSTRFTFTALLTYIQNLDPITNQGLVLSIMSQASDVNLTETELALLGTEIENRVGGKFDFVLFREDDSELDGYETEMGD